MTAPTHSRLLVNWRAAGQRLGAPPQNVAVGDAIDVLVGALAALPEAEHAVWLAGLLEAMEVAGLPGIEQTMDDLSELIAWRMVKGEW